MNETDKAEAITFPAFRAEINKNIKRTIKLLRAQGTVSMSRRNLLQVTPTPKLGQNQGPQGINSHIIYSEMFYRELDNLSKPYRSFAYFA